MSKNIRSLSHSAGIESNLFSAIAKAAQTAPASRALMLEQLADTSKLSLSILHGTASFYDFLRPDENDLPTRVCHGTACMVSGSTADVVRKYPDAGKVMCCGYCYQGAGILQRDADGKLHSCHADTSATSQPPMPVYDLSSSGILTCSTLSVEQLYEVGLKAPKKILMELQASGLRGRGGAGFSFAFKCQAVAEETGDEKYIVCNADEGDPGAFSDRYLLEQHPHKILAGMFAAGMATGASTGVLYIRYEYPEAVRSVQQAIDEYAETVAGNTSCFSFHVIVGAGSCVCGEETALLNSIEGQRPEVRVRPPYPASQGLWGMPTLVSNVETFANVPWILEHGGESYARIGSRDSKGSKLLSLDSQFVRPGLYEVDFGCSFSELIFEQAGGFNTETKALQVGGPLGSILPVSTIHDLEVDFESFQQAGFALGHAGIVAIPQTFSMLDFMVHIFSYMAEESCGKCTPCRLGTAKGRLLLEQAKEGIPLDKRLFNDLLELLEVGSLCALGGGLPLPIRNMLTHFEQELRPFFTSACLS